MGFMKVQLILCYNFSKWSLLLTEFYSSELQVYTAVALNLRRMYMMLQPSPSV
jgi:hypothetical protein